MIIKSIFTTNFYLQISNRIDKFIPREETQIKKFTFPPQNFTVVKTSYFLNVVKNTFSSIYVLPSA